MDPGERRQADITGGLGLDDREPQRGDTRVVVAGLALGSPEARHLVRLRLLKSPTSRGFRGATEVNDSVVEATLDTSQFAEHCVAANVQPRVVDDA